MSTRFKDKVALVTGASGGIGQALAARFAAEGARLVLLDRDLEALTSLASRHADAQALACDVADPAQVDAAIDAALQAHGRIDIAVLNAGIEGRVAEIEHQAVADFDQVMGVNVRGVFLCLRRLMPAMKAARGGAITVLSSTAGLRAAIGLAPYVTSKHAVLGLVKAAALEGAQAGVRVNAVNPGPVETRMIRALEEASGAGERARALTEQGIPLHRLGTPAEVAAMVAFLSSDEAGFATGGSYLLDGGIMAGRGR